MVKIKQKKQLNLPQLIEWAWENPKLSNGISILSNDWENVRINFKFNPRGVLSLDILNGRNISDDILFTLKVEEEITEETVIDKLMTTFKKTYLEGGIGYQRVRIDDNYPIKLMLNKAEAHREPVETLHIVNEDGTHTLIWRDGKLVD
ncbi:hypothetical protein QI050_11795 [Staphylococcus saprophyticus]|nr:hypothetical protein [Staphylococcus saprophyticus]MDW4426299.1 hypothetical protein [Staphylococcus saprophyticus]